MPAVAPATFYLTVSGYLNSFSKTFMSLLLRHHRSLSYKLNYSKFIEPVKIPHLHPQVNSKQPKNTKKEQKQPLSVPFFRKK
jgi:hypothetical protein